MVRTRRALHRGTAALAIGLSAATGLAGCTSITESKADATVKLQAEDQPAVLRLRQEILTGAKTWGAVRIGEESSDSDRDSVLVFSLPGPNLDAALGGLNRLDATIESTDIDVAPEKLDRNVTTTIASGTPKESESQNIRLKVEIEADRGAGFGGFFRLVMAILSVVGAIVTFRWAIRGWRHLEDRWRTRHDDHRGDGPDDGPGGPNDAGGPNGTIGPDSPTVIAGTNDPPTRENQPARVVGDW